MRHGTYSHALTKEDTGMNLCKITTCGAKKAHTMECMHGMYAWDVCIGLVSSQ